MSGLGSGIYSLRLAASPSPLVGGVLRGVATQPVVTKAYSTTWAVTKVGSGQYTLVLQDVEGDLPAFNNGNDVFAGGNPPTVWEIDGPEGGPYTIQLPNSGIVWTVNEPDDGSPTQYPVVLQPIQQGPPENQKWYFVQPQ